MSIFSKITSVLQSFVLTLAGFVGIGTEPTPNPVAGLSPEPIVIEQNVTPPTPSVLITKSPTSTKKASSAPAKTPTPTSLKTVTPTPDTRSLITKLTEQVKELKNEVTRNNSAPTQTPQIIYVPVPTVIVVTPIPPTLTPKPTIIFNFPTVLPSPTPEPIVNISLTAQVSGEVPYNTGAAGAYIPFGIKFIGDSYGMKINNIDYKVTGLSADEYRLSVNRTATIYNGSLDEAITVYGKAVNKTFTITMTINNNDLANPKFHITNPSLQIGPIKTVLGIDVTGDLKICNQNNPNFISELLASAEPTYTGQECEEKINRWKSQGLFEALKQYTLTL